MFRILISQIDNVNPKIGLLPVNYIPIEWTSLLKGGRPIYDGGMAHNHIMSKLDDQIKTIFPSMIDIGHINCTSNEGRHHIAELCEIYHNLSGYGSQVGFCKLWPTSSKTLAADKIVASISRPFQQDRYGQPNVLKLIQFITCWAHPFTTVWDEWEELLEASITEASKYHKPVYADMSVLFHPTSKALAGKLIEPSRLKTMLKRIYSAGFDGVMIRDYGPELKVAYYEAILSSLNQINE